MKKKLIYTNHISILILRLIKKCEGKDRMLRNYISIRIISFSKMQATSFKFLVFVARVYGCLFALKSLLILN